LKNNRVWMRSPRWNLLELCCDCEFRTGAIVTAISFAQPWFRVDSIAGGAGLMEVYALAGWRVGHKPLPATPRDEQG